MLPYNYINYSIYKLLKYINNYTNFIDIYKISHKYGIMDYFFSLYFIPVLIYFAQTVRNWASGIPFNLGSV